MAKLQITYTKSAIGYSKDQKATIASLGLRKLNSSVIHDDTPAIRGMAFKVRHLVTVSEVTGDQPAKPAAKANTLTITKAAAQTEPTPRRKAAPAPATAAAAEVEAPTAKVQAPAPATAAAEVEAPATKGKAPEPDATTAEAETPVSAKAKSPASDDLEAIEGIGPKIAGVLKDAGIATFAELAATDASRLSEILHDANLRLADPTTWPEQAQLAAEGKWDEFKELQNNLKGGRRE